MSRLSRYREKRDFDQTPEPEGGGARRRQGAPTYSIQRHAATRLHHDLRLEHDGVLLSFAITRGPSLDPDDKRLAVRTEDHPLDYLDFEGTIPKGNYGAGTVMLWDIGHWQPFHDVEEGLEKGHIHFRLHGARLGGNWSLVRMGEGGGKVENWLLIKEDDAAAHGPDPVLRFATSVTTARTMEEIAKGREPTRHGPQRRRRAPGFVKPQLAELGSLPAEDDAHWAELKLDGYRALVALGRGGARIYTRNGHDWSDRFLPLLSLIEGLPASNALVDAEIIAGGGLQGFSALQEAISVGGPFRLVAFDLLHLDGRDLTGLPLRKRRAALEKLFADVPPMGLLRLSPVIPEGWQSAFDLICAQGGEGLIVKRIAAPYRSGRGPAWRKVKCVKTGTFVIVGWEPSKGRGRPFGGLHLAEDTAKGLLYRGRVGTGFDEATLETLATRLTALAADKAPLKVPGIKGARWVRPELLAEVRFSEITSSGRLRHPVFLGLRDDLATPRVATGDREMIGGVALSSPDRKVFPGITKRALAEYFLSVADRMLPEVANRPLSLVRLPDGISGERFYQKHAGKGFPDALRRGEAQGREIMFIDDAEGLVAAVQMGAVEFHISGARLDREDMPDRLVFDLDPDEGLGWPKLRAAAIEVREDLLGLGLDPWPLATGGKGLHVVVPLRRTATWETVRLFAQTYAALKEAAAPNRFTASISKSKRKGRVFVDWLRNDPAASAVAPWSVRARTQPKIAVPLTWETVSDSRRLPGVSLKEALSVLPEVVGAGASRSISQKVVKALAELQGSV